MRTIWLLIKKDIIRFWKDKPVVGLTFVVPAVLILIFGSIFGGSGTQSRGKINILFVNESNSLASKLIETKLDSSETLNPVKYYSEEGSSEVKKYDKETAVSRIKKGDFPAAVVLPSDFFRDTSSSLKFQFFYDPRNDIESAMIQGSLREIIMTQSSRLMPVLMNRQADAFLGSDSGMNFRNDMSAVVKEYFGFEAGDNLIGMQTEIDSSIFEEDTSGAGLGDMMQNLVKFQSEQVVGEEIANPGITRMVGGWAIMFLLFSITGAATSLFEEKQEGSLKRLLCMPVKRSEILWSKYLYSMGLGIVQLTVMFLFAWLVYGIDIFSNFFNLSIVIIASAAAAVAFGMIITSFAKSLNQANGIATLIILVMSALGGSWFPIFLFPEWMQAIAKFTLTYWSVDAFQQVMWRQAGFGEIALHVFILFSIAFIVNFYSLIRFRKGLVF